ncbi:MAG TPA: FAD binding domain-containing protein [Pseudonocardiaceae bacterium]|nr:FAD binding domain-containing protein [Pseudonocardiaceae bacterium]
MMILRRLQYTAPDTLADALADLSEEDDSLPIAGGNGLLTLLKRGELNTSRLVDIGRIAELRGVRVVEAGRMRAGALTTLTDLCIEPVVRTAHMPGVLTDAVDVTGDVQCRNRATVGGTVASADPGSDFSAALLALDATICIAGKAGQRVASVADLFAGTEKVRQGELIVWVEIGPASPGSAYTRFADRATLTAICGIAVAVTPAPDDTVAEVSVAITGGLAAPRRLPEVERSLLGRPLSAPVEVAIADDFVSSPAASGDYRAHLAAVLAQRTFDTAVQRAKRA